MPDDNPFVSLFAALDAYGAGCLQVIPRDDDGHPEAGVFVTRDPALIAGFQSVEGAWSDEQGPLAFVPGLEAIVADPVAEIVRLRETVELALSWAEDDAEHEPGSVSENRALAHTAAGEAAR